jgi:ribonuclease BN (tRNA processing enzyme)
VAAFAVVATSTTAAQQPSTRATAPTKIVLLGTGTPGPTPDRSGPATAIVVNDTPYLVDFGPGVVRRASAAATSRGIAALQPVNLRIVFATHLHSDHTVGYPDLIFTPWTVGRREPLEVCVSDDELQTDMMSRYQGHFVIGRDLDVY